MRKETKQMFSIIAPLVLEFVRAWARTTKTPLDDAAVAVFSNLNLNIVREAARAAGVDTNLPVAQWLAEIKRLDKEYWEKLREEEELGNEFRRKHGV